MAKHKETVVKPKKNIGDRIMQIILLLLIATGILSIPVIMRGESLKDDPGKDIPEANNTEGRRSISENKSVVVETDTVKLADVSKFIRVNGDVEAGSSVNIYPDIPGKIIDLSVSIGDAVEQGETLGYVDRSLPGQEYSVSAVKATISGTIISLNHDIGETVSTQTPFAVIGNLNDLEIVTFVPERYVGTIKTGQVAELRLDAYPDEVFNSVVTEISPVLDAASRTMQVTLSPSDKDARLKVGMFASLRIVIARSENAVSISPASLTSYYGETVVYVVENNRAIMRKVTPGLASADIVEILEGLEQGEIIVLRGLNGVTNGAAVRVVNQE